MNFVDPVFLWVLPFFLLIYAILRGSWQKAWLLVASYIFYGWCSPEYTLLLLVSTLLDYVVALGLEKFKCRRGLIWLSVIFNLGLLAYFKYAALFWNSILIPLMQGLNLPMTAMAATLPPVGISFFTFQTMSYTLDVYRGDLKASKSFLNFATYVSMFPQLVAGPIVRASDLLAQIDGQRRIGWENFKEGSLRFAIGFFKKTCIADALAISFVDGVFAQPDQASAMARVLAMLAYSFQIYYDFSAYSDMAVGLGKIMGYDFPENFKYPYRSVSFSDFWSRWHISLSTWLRDYLYIPLGGNRKGVLRTMINLLLTMLLGGLWHGASWLFVLWGALHGLALILQRLYASVLPYKWRSLVPNWLKVLVIFVAVTLMWVPFRALRVADIRLFWSAIFELKVSEIANWVQQRPEDFGLLAMSLGLHFVRGSLAQKVAWSHWPLWIKTIVWASLLFWLLNFYPQNALVQPFIYFQF